jgi:cholesterol oxidase
MITLTASGVGGGSLIYADVQTQPDDAFLDHFPAEISAAEMGPYYQRVREVLQPSPLPERPSRTAVFR